LEEGKFLIRDSNLIDIILSVMKISKGDIDDIAVMKKGMTNRSYVLSCKGDKYIVRIPGEGTDQLINRREEASVYQAIAERKICDDIIYIDAENGYKITKYYDNARVCDPYNQQDVQRCMDRLREFHSWNLTVEHEFDIFRQIQFYESLRDGRASCFNDYEQTKSNTFSLKGYIDTYAGNKVLTHIDAVPDNFLFIRGDNGEEIRLIDWEYAGMQDPHVDIAMFAVYSMYDREHIDQLINMYFSNKCPVNVRTKIYCYIAACGLLWSNWCEYKGSFGLEFGEYSLKQYQYAKEYYQVVQTELEERCRDA